MDHLLIYGLIAVGVIIILFLVFFLIFKKMFQVNVESGKGWIIIGYILSGVVGFVFSKIISTFFYFQIRNALILEWAIIILSIIAFEFLYWRFFVFHSMDRNSNA